MDGHLDGQGWLAASKNKHPIVFHHFLGVYRDVENTE
jgi:hypothetical protein